MHATFLLRNHGVADSVTVGFPIGVRSTLEDDYVFDFRVQVDGQPVHANKVDDPLIFAGRDTLPEFLWPAWHGWYVWSTYLKSEVTTTVTVNYETHSQIGAYTGNPYGMFTYILATGRAWRDRIDFAKIHVTFEGMDMAQVTWWSPDDGVVGPGQEITWLFRDFEPTPTAVVRIWYEAEVPASAMSWNARNLGIEEEESHFGRHDVSGLSILLHARIDSLIRADTLDTEAAREYLQDNIDGVQGPALLAGIALQDKGDFIAALAYYEDWERAFGDISNRLRPFSLLKFRMAECRFQLGQLDAAAEGFRSVLQPDSLDKERYERGLGNMGVDNDPEFGSEEALWEYRFFLSRGLNAFCRMRMQQIELKRQGTRKPH